jgi:C4-dicarboxylate-specific signal transduction histidine kinase
MQWPYALGSKHEARAFLDVALQKRIVRPLRAVAERAHQISSGARPAVWPRGGIVELNRLSDDLGTMGEAIWRREEELRRLNEELEARVAHRTEDLSRSNRELHQALATLEQARDELVNSEKLAALGRLVAGVAHELNTPLGNGRMAITTLVDKLANFERNVAEGLRRSQLESFIESVRTSTEIAERNLVRASDLIGSFKQVAADRTASRRRKFRLREIVDEVILTLSPSMKGQPVELRVDLPRDLWLDSYPGELGQVLTNLIENCVTHAFKGCERCSITIDAKLHDPENVLIRVSDNGTGMAADIARRAFDPFFTTTLGRGGTGLGLFIVHNAVTNVLGGTISLDSQPGMGTRFELCIPLVAPAAPQDRGLQATRPDIGA